MNLNLPKIPVTKHVHEPFRFFILWDSDSRETASVRFRLFFLTLFLPHIILIFSLILKRK